MGCAHIVAAVVIGAAEGHGQEGFLLGMLCCHIGGFEKMVDVVIGQYSGHL